MAPLQSGEGAGFSGVDTASALLTLCQAIMYGPHTYSTTAIMLPGAMGSATVVEELHLRAVSLSLPPSRLLHIPIYPPSDVPMCGSLKCGNVLNREILVGL